jgi:hypothetical protein
MPTKKLKRFRTIQLKKCPPNNSNLFGPLVKTINDNTMPFFGVGPELVKELYELWATPKKHPDYFTKTIQPTIKINDNTIPFFGGCLRALRQRQKSTRMISQNNSQKGRGCPTCPTSKTARQSGRCQNDLQMMRTNDDHTRAKPKPNLSKAKTKLKKSNSNYIYNNGYEFLFKKHFK